MKALFRVDKAFAYGSDMLSALYPERDMAALRKRVEERPRYFEEYITQNLMDNPHRLTSIVTMDLGYDEIQQKELDSILREEIGKHPESEDELFREFSKSEDAPELYSNFRSLSLEDVENAKFENNPGAWDAKIVSIPYFSNGIVYLDAAFDVTDFTMEELESLNVYARLLTMCSTEDKGLIRVQTDIRYSSGGYAFYIESGESLEGKVKIYFLFRMRALRETCHEALNEFIGLLKRGLVLEGELSNALMDISTDYRSGVIQSGHSYAISASSAPLTSSLYIGEKLSGLSYWYTIEKKKEDVTGERERILLVRDKLLDASRIRVQTLSDRDNTAFMQGEAEFFISSFESKTGAIGENLIMPSFPRASAFLLSTPVSYSALSALTDDLTWEEMLSARMFLSILSSDTLWDLIRAKGGAYGTGCMLDNLENRLFFYSYRDPRGLMSFDDYGSAVRMQKIDESKLNDARINIKSLDWKPQSPSQRALTYLRRRLFAVSDEYRRRLRSDINALSVSDLENIRSKLSSHLGEGSSKSVIMDRKEEERLRSEGYEIFLLPL